MTRILVQRGSSGSSSSNQNKSSTSVSVPIPSSSLASPPQQVTSSSQVVPTVKDDNLGEELQEQIVVDELPEHSGVLDNKSENLSTENLNSEQGEGEKNVHGEKVSNDDIVGSGILGKGCGGLPVVEEESDGVESSFQMATASSYPPPPPLPPAKLSLVNSNSRRFASADPNTVRIGSSRRGAGWSGVSSRSSPTGSRPSSPRSHGEGEGYNSADEQSPCFSSSYDDAVSIIHLLVRVIMEFHPFNTRSFR